MGIRLFLALWVSTVLFAGEVPKECLTLDPRFAASLVEGDPALAAALGITGRLKVTTEGTDTVRAGDTTAEDLPSVRDALAYEKEHGRLDFILAAGATSAKPIPKFNTPAEAQAAHDRLTSPYSRLLLASHARDILPNAEARQLEAARAVLRSHFEKPPSFYGERKETEEVLAALALIGRAGTASDVELLAKAGKWAEWFPETFKVTLARAKARIGSETTSTPAQIKEFTDAVFADATSHRPDVAIHKKHSERVAELVVALRKAQLKKAGLPEMSKSEIENLWVAAYAHDLGKALWPKSLLAKRSRMSDSDYQVVVRKVAAAGMKLNDALGVMRVLTKLNGEISPEKPEPEKPTPEDLMLLRRHGILTEAADKPGVLTAEETGLLLSDRINLSGAERALVNEHVGGYRILMVLSPGGLSPRLAQVHHELLNGTGYPFGLKGGDLDPIARLMTVADIYDAVTGPRPNSPSGAPPAAGIGALRNPYHKERVDQEVVNLLEELVGAKAAVTPQTGSVPR